MEAKLLFKRGNLFTGYPWGVEAELQFGCSELHGPFSSENQANTYAHELSGQIPASEYVSVKVVKIETPQAGVQILIGAGGERQYAAVRDGVLSVGDHS